jgi:uncharacterized protein YgbK (DUF1537 family)
VALGDEAELDFLERFRRYKVCSTCDSSPEMGSFGTAIALGRELFDAQCVPFVAAQPEFGRFTAFANHFARGDAQMYRLDRHPTMSRHPSTPIDEADLRRFLGRQTDVPIETLDLAELALPREQARPILARRCADGPRVVVFDAVEQRALEAIGDLVWNAPARSTVFALGSGGLSYGIGAHLTGRPAAELGAGLSPVDALLVVSGSCAPRAGEQIRWAAEHGWVTLPLDPLALLDPIRAEATIATLTATMLAELARGRSVVIHSAEGPNDPSIAAVSEAARERDEATSFAALLGATLARFVRAAVTDGGIRRCIIAGGDTSGYTISALDAYALEIAALPVIAGAVNRLHSANPAFDGLEVMLKGGQVGEIDLFERIRRGRTHTDERREHA